MKLEELFDRRGNGIDERGIRQPVEHPYEVEHRRMPHDVQRMVLAERRPPVDFAAEVERLPRRLRTNFRGRTRHLLRSGRGFWRWIVHADATDYGDSPAEKSSENILFC